MAEKNGALSAFGVKEFDDLSAGFNRSNPAFGFNGPSKSNVAGALASIGSAAAKASPIGQAFGLANIAGNISAEQAASASLGRSPTYSAAILGDTIQGALTNNMSPSSMSMARSQADTNKDGRVSAIEAQNYGMGKGLTAYDVGVNMARPSVNMNRSFSNRQMRDNPPAVSNLNPSSLANPANYANKDYGPSYSSTASSTLEGVKDNLGINPSPSSIANPANFTNKDYGPKGPPKGLGNQPQEAPSEDSSSGPTYICTVIFEQGDMKKSVYKYDKLYGTVAHENLFAGYAVWGKPLANLMKRNKIVYKIAKPIALSWANQMAYDKSGAVTGKRSITGKLIKYIGEPLCYAIGFVINRRRKWLKST
tara:strand:- start:1333 stop:2427 length:1095 start_codon:yes stop_codon:yes gene_type:complete